MATRALVALVAGLGGIVALASGSASASAPPLPSPKPKPKPPVGGGSSGTSSSTVKLSVSYAQRTLMALGAKLDADGLYGPKTRSAWESAAKSRGLVPTFERVDGQTARVDGDTSRKLSALAIGRGAAARSSGQSSSSSTVALGPITTVKNAGGVEVRSTDLASMTPAERREWAQQTGDYSVWGGSSLDLLSDEQAEAMENAGVQQARANMDPSNATQQERAKLAAQKARELLGGKRGATGVPKVPSNPTIAPEQERGEDVPLAYVSPPTPINLETARKEAPALAKHLRSKGRAGYARQSVRAFQGHAGITVDGIYGPLTESALRHFGVSNPPAAFFKAKAGSVVTYQPT